MKRICRAGAVAMAVALCIAILFLTQPGSVGYPGLREGRVTISDESFMSNRELFLAGEWTFCFGELLGSADLDAGERVCYYTLPDFWQRDWNDERVEMSGYGTYRLLIDFETPKETVTLYVPWIFGAYEVFANGESVLRCGVVGTDAESERPETRPMLTTIPLHGDRLELIIHVSGHISGLSGLMHPIALGSDASVLRNVGLQIAQDAIFVGCFLIMGFYHLAMHFLRRKDRATIFFAALCLAALVRQGTISFGLLHSIIPGYNGFAMYDLYVASNLWLIAFFGIFSYHLLGKKHEVGRRSMTLLLGLSTVTTVAHLLWRYHFSYLNFYLAYGCYVLCSVYILRVLRVIFKHKDEHRFLYLCGAILLFLANGVDVMRDFGLVRSGHLFGNSAFVAVTFIETIILARIFIGYSNENELLVNYMEALVAVRTAELADANKQLLLLERSRNELISNVSHDLRTPMTAIRGYMELLMKGDLPKDTAKEYITGAHARTEQMETLIKDLFLLAQLTERSIPMALDDVSVSELFESLCKTYQPIAQTRELSLIWSADADAANVFADRGFLVRIMDNLVQNALAYAETEIRVSARIDSGTEEYVMFSVADDGPGIDEEQLPFVFDRFYKKRKDGAGLGLCIVKELAALMGGDVSARSVPYEQTEFIVKLRLSAGVQTVRNSDGKEVKIS